MYATSAQGLATVLSRTEGVAQASIDLAAGRVTIDAFPARSSRTAFERVLESLGFRAAETNTANEAREFVIRAGSASVLALAVLWGLAAHVGLVVWANAFHQALWLAGLAALALCGAAWPLYRRAVAAVRRGLFDASVVAALVALAAFVCGVYLALLSPNAWFAGGRFSVATAMTAGWFIARGFTALVLPCVAARHPLPAKNLAALSTPQSQLGVIPDGSRR